MPPLVREKRPRQSESALLTPQPPAPERFAYVDALRGLAALYVLAFHVALMPRSPLALPGWASPVILNGGSGVTLFFVVSAFTLCHTLRARAGTARATLKFYIRRAFRIGPLYYAWLALLLFAAARGGVLWELDKWKVLASLTLTINLYPGWREGIVWASWTIGVEVLFYLMFPALFRVVRSLPRAAALVVVSLPIAWAHDAVARAVIPPSDKLDQLIHLALPTQLPVFAVGMLTYFIYDRLRPRERPRPIAGAAMLAAGLVAFVTIPLAGSSTVVTYLMSLDYMVILLGLSLLPVGLIVNRFTTFLGTVSYSVYLNHPQAVIRMQPVYQRIYALEAPTTLQFLACVALTVVPVVAVSYLTYRLIEQPGIRLGSRIIRSLGGDSAGSQPRPVSAATAPAP